MQESRRAMTLSPNREPLESHAIQKHIELVWLAEKTANKVGTVSLQLDLEDVLAVKWEVMVNRNSSTRAEGEILTQTTVLHEALGNVVFLTDHGGGVISNCHASNLSCR